MKVFSLALLTNQNDLRRIIDETGVRCGFSVLKFEEVTDADAELDFSTSNRARDMYFVVPEGGGVIFIPKGWIDEMSEIDQEDGLTVYGYGPTSKNDDSVVATYWYPVKQLSIMQEIDKTEAMELHPQLFIHLDKLNQFLIDTIEKSGSPDSRTDPQ